MKTSLFSDSTNRMLEDNELEVNKNGSFLTFKKVSSSKALLLIPVFFLTLIAVVHIQQHPIKTLIAILTIALVTKVIWNALTKKNHFQIDFADNTFKFYDLNKNLHWHYLKDIEEILWSSKFVSEYSNEFKNSSARHEVSIIIKINGGKALSIFKLFSDYAAPTPEIHEIYSFLENHINSLKQISS